MLDEREYKIFQMNDGIFEMKKDAQNPLQVEYYLYDIHALETGKTYICKQDVDFDDVSSLIKEGIALQWEEVLKKYGNVDKKICKIFKYGDYIIEIQENIENPLYIDFYFSNPNYIVATYMFQKIIDFNDNNALESCLTSTELEKIKKEYQELYENEENLKTTKEDKIFQQIMADKFKN